MGLEAATFIHQLNPLNPVGAVDPKAQGDDHIRMVKATLQATFPNIAGAMTVSHTRLNAIDATGFTGFAAPTVKVDLAAGSAGVATTALRSDAKLQLDQAIAPTWSGVHTFTAGLGVPNLAANNVTVGAASGGGKIKLVAAAGGVNGKVIELASSGTLLVLRSVDDADSGTRNLLLGTKSGLAWSDVSFGNATDNPTYQFLGTGTASFGGFTWVGPNNLAAGANLSVGMNTAASIAGASRGCINVNGLSDAVYALCINGTLTGYLYSAATELRLNAVNNVPINFYTNNLIRFNIANDGGFTSNGVTGGSKGNGTINVADAYINNIQVGYRSVPRSTTSTTLAASDNGKCVAVSAAINIPASVFSAGDCVSIYNDSAAAVNITISAGTLRLAGTTTTGTRTLAARGMATLWFNVGGATPEVIASGAGIS